MNWKKFLKPELTKILLAVFITIFHFIPGGFCLFYLTPLYLVITFFPFTKIVLPSTEIIIDIILRSMELIYWYFIFSLVIHIKNNWKKLSSPIKGGIIAQIIPFLLLLFTVLACLSCEDWDCLSVPFFGIIAMISIPIFFIIGYLIGKKIKTIMSWKEFLKSSKFLKPSKRKMFLFTLILIISMVETLIVSIVGTATAGLCEPMEFSYNLILFPFYFYEKSWDSLHTYCTTDILPIFPSLLYWYLFSCLIIWVYDKLKKH